jgi:hypothetical protein
MKTLLTPKKYISSVWETVGDIIAHPRVLNNWTDKDDLYKRLKEDKADLWVSSTLKSALIASLFVRKDGSKTYVVDYMASLDEDEDWTQAIEAIEDHARLIGCSSIQVRGRKGWKRVLKDYKEIQTTLERKL